MNCARQILTNPTDVSRPKIDDDEKIIFNIAGKLYEGEVSVDDTVMFSVGKKALYLTDTQFPMKIIYSDVIEVQAAKVSKESAVQLTMNPQQTQKLNNIPFQQKTNILNLLVANSRYQKELLNHILTAKQNFKPIIQAAGLSNLAAKRAEEINQNQQIVSQSFSNFDSLKQNSIQLLQLANQLKSQIKSIQNPDVINEAQELLEQIYGFEQTNQTISNIVVKESVSKKKYYAALKEEIIGYLSQYFKVGALNLAQLYARYSRARKTNLVSPGDFYQILSQLAKTDGFQLIKCNNVEMLLQVDRRSQLNFKEKLLADIKNKAGNQGILEKHIIQMCSSNDDVINILEEYVLEGALAVYDNVQGRQYFQNLF